MIPKRRTTTRRDPALGRPALTDRDIRALVGGADLLRARDRVLAWWRREGRAEQRLAGGQDGWNGIRRGSDVERVLPSELLVDSTEFLRRAIDGELLELERSGEPRAPTATMLAIDLTAAALGRTLRTALGVALALAQYSTKDEPCRISIDAGEATTLTSLADLERLLEWSPPTRPIETDRWSRRLALARRSAAWRVCWIELDAEAGSATRRSPRREKELAFRVLEDRVTCRTPDARSPGQARDERIC